MATVADWMGRPYDLQANADRRAVAAFAVSLESPLTPGDIADGWTDELRLSTGDAICRVLADLEKGWGDQAEHESRHMMRALNRVGISAWSEGPLSQSASEAISALGRLRPALGEGSHVIKGRLRP